MMDWAGGLIWLALDDADAMANRIREIAEMAGGQANLVRAPERMRETVPVFHPESPALARINAKIKENFDPEGILNPGRLTPGTQIAEGA